MHRKLHSFCFDTLTGIFLPYFTKCQNEKYRQKTQNRASDGTFTGLFQG